PSKPMETEAVKAGYYTNPHDASFPKIQILTIDDLLTGAKRPLYSDLAQGAVTFKKAGREEKRHDQSDLF
ncbi:MAG: site-specific DNA-methyltransferase, partial [Betaproteobacteria bacterium]|nr:site-specific DNA-methyltransferase [Betaproteobacteria bacterium]